MKMFRSGLPLLPRIRRRLSALLPSIAGFLVLAGQIASSAYAQYYNRGLPAFHEPDALDMLPSRFATILIAAVVGFLVGAFFSPAARPFRRVLLFVALGLSILFALFGPVPAADAFSYFVSFIVAIVAFASVPRRWRHFWPRATGRQALAQRSGQRSNICLSTE